MPVSAYYRNRTVYRIGSTIGQCEQAVSRLIYREWEVLKYFLNVCIETYAVNLISMLLMYVLVRDEYT